MAAYEVEGLLIGLVMTLPPPALAHNHPAEVLSVSISFTGLYDVKINVQLLARAIFESARASTSHAHVSRLTTHNSQFYILYNLKAKANKPYAGYGII
jgi:hypothetical protein